MDTLPKIGFCRLRQIIGDPKANPPIPPFIPVGKSQWWKGVKDGRFPKPVKLGPKTTAWVCEQIHETAEKLRKQAEESE